MFMKKGKNEEVLMYRLRNKKEKEVDMKKNYTKTKNIEEVLKVIEEYLNKNFLLTVTLSKSSSFETYKKDVAILNSFDEILEMDRAIYDKYKDLIDMVLLKNMYKMMDENLIDENTEIYVNFITSGCKVNCVEDKNALYKTKNIKNIETLYISVQNPKTYEIFRNILIDFLSTSEDTPKIDFVGGYKLMGEQIFLLQLGDRIIKFNKEAYSYVLEIIEEFDRKRKIEKDNGRQLKLVKNDE